MSAFSGSKRDRSAQIVFPAVENTRSLGVEEAWTHKYEKARHDRGCSRFTTYAVTFLWHSSTCSGDSFPLAATVNGVSRRFFGG